MARAVQIVVPTSISDEIAGQLRQVDGLVGLRLQRQVSLQPPGDLISLELTTAGLPGLMRQLDQLGIGRTPGTSITTSRPAAIISSGFADQLANDPSELTWEEMEREIGRESNMNASGLLVMAIAGIIAVLGITTGAIHLVVGAMLIAPGFEPLTRIALGLVAGSPAWRRGLRHSATGYLALLAGAAAMTLLLRAMGFYPLHGQSTLMPSATLVSYWTSITLPSVLASVAAAAGGALLIAGGRAILTGGVMIALALIPTAAIVAMAMFSGDWALSGKAAMRWLIDAGLVIILSGAVLGWHRIYVQRRKAML
jgi:hypothetical protein